MKSTPRRARLDWAEILATAADIVAASAYPMSLRALHYRLLGQHGYVNSLYCYKHLSSVSAQARRLGTFPPLAEDVRNVEQPIGYGSAAEAVRDVSQWFRLDRTEGQPYAIHVVTEKRTLLPMIAAEVADPYGLPYAAISGYSSQTLADLMAQRVEADGRPAVLIIATDFDPSGEDLARDFLARTDCWHAVERVALTAEQEERGDLVALADEWAS